MHRRTKRQPYCCCRCLNDRAVHVTAGGGARGTGPIPAGHCSPDFDTPHSVRGTQQQPRGDTDPHCVVRGDKHSVDGSSSSSLTIHTSNNHHSPPLTRLQPLTISRLRWWKVAVSVKVDKRVCLFVVSAYSAGHPQVATLAFMVRSTVRTPTTASYSRTRPCSTTHWHTRIHTQQ